VRYVPAYETTREPPVAPPMVSPLGRFVAWGTKNRMVPQFQQSSILL
jgi:hypothetical protein